VERSARSEDLPLIGLRAWKKARTRERISEVATGLIIAHGFEQVTMAQIAAAAEVSVKTIFNYFPGKEDLFFDRADDVLGAVIDAISERPAGSSIIDAVRTVLAGRRVPFDLDGWRALRVAQRYDDFRSFIAAAQASPALRARRLVIAEGWIERLAKVLARELDLVAGDRRAVTFAAMIVAVMSRRDQELSSAMLQRASPRIVERRVRATVDEGLDRLSLAYADLDHPRPA
jgi:AcrR family transcriptional regulator